MQESKKKVLHSGSLGEKIADPVAYRSKIVDGKLCNRLAGDTEANLLEAFYQEASDGETRAEGQSPTASRLTVSKDDQRPALGKRSTSHKPSRQTPDSEEPQTFKYCDPQTGAYFNSIEEFRRIRQLRDLEREQKIEKELQFLNTFMLSKKKKLNSLISESYD